MQTDSALLDRYLRERDQAAFTALVRRYLDLVYSSAARRVGDRHLAEDVTQAVFMIFAKKASSARRSSSLGAWLLNTVRYAAANALKMEDRRQRHQTKAAAQASASAACSPNPPDVLVWQEIAAHLDDAVLALPARDRQAVVLRYFQDKSINDIAAAMNTTEGAAKQRLSRSLEKLRRKLTSRGAIFGTEGAVALSSLLAAHALRAAPANLLAAATAASVSASAASAASVFITKGAITMMTWTKIKTVAALVLIASAVGSGVIVTTQIVGAQGSKQLAAQPRAATGPLADKASARLAAAQDVVTALDIRARANEPLTPTFVELQGLARRRLTEAKLEVTDDAGARAAIVQQHIKECRDYHALLKNRMGAGADVSNLQVSQWAYHLADAEYLLAKVQAGR
jgi:RNA polymerase sigma factor (sigma-70 family)